MRKLHFSDIRNDRGVINSDLRNSKVIKNTLSNLCLQKFDDSGEMDQQISWNTQSTETHTRKKIDNLNNSGEVWLLAYNLVWYFKLDYRQLQRLYLAGLRGKQTFPLDAETMNCSFWKVTGKGSGPAGHPCSYI